MIPALALAAAVASLALAGPPAQRPPGPKELQELLEAIAAEAPRLTPGTEVAIAVQKLPGGPFAAVNGDVPHVSASSAKLLWTVAALEQVPLSKVAPPAEKVFRTSDNEAAGEIIDLVGAEAVNAYFSRLGLRHTALTSWGSGGRRRKPQNSPDEMDGDNYFTAADAVSFLARLARGELLPAEKTAEVRTWLRWTPRQGCGGWLTARLPAEVRPRVEHKAGWLPPGCCSDDAAYNTLTEIGLVPLPDGTEYAVAILARRCRDWRRQERYAERASCELYRSLAGRPALDCEDSPAAPELLPDGGAPPPDCE